MTNVIQLATKYEKQVSCETERFCDQHPCLTFFAALIVMPISIVAIVFVATGVVMLPLSALLGWI